MLLPFPVLRLDAAGRVLESNGVLEREIGVSANALLDRAIQERLDERGKRALDEALGTSVPARLVELRFPAAIVRRPPRAFHLVRHDGLLWLVGQLLAMDEQRDDLIGEATSAKYRFLATMSHELRTPLNAVLGYAGLLRDGVYGDITQPQERAIRSMVRRAQDLQLLIDDVLDLSRVEAGRMELRIDEFDPGTVIAEVKDEITPLINEKELDIVVRYNLRGTVRADRAKYRQVIVNLVSNAVKFTPGRGELVISLEGAPDDRFVTRVSDTGIGISREKLETIFDTFQQVESGTTRRYQGLGLGLSIVRRMVQVMGGTVDVQSDMGHGATFTVTLPTHPDSDVIATSVEDTSADTRGDPIVLAIDDDPEVIALLRDSLAPAHFRVVGALSGNRGLELARILQPFAITLDIMMPEKDGWQVLREIRNDPAISEIPVIVMSIVSEPALGASLGVTDYLVKPVDRRVLLGALQRLPLPLVQARGAQSSPSR